VEGALVRPHGVHQVQVQILMFAPKILQITAAPWECGLFLWEGISHFAGGADLQNLFGDGRRSARDAGHGRRYAKGWYLRGDQCGLFYCCRGWRGGCGVGDSRSDSIAQWRGESGEAVRAPVPQPREHHSGVWRSRVPEVAPTWRWRAGGKSLSVVRVFSRALPEVYRTAHQIGGAAEILRDSRDHQCGGGVCDDDIEPRPRVLQQGEKE